MKSLFKLSFIAILTACVGGGGGGGGGGSSSGGDNGGSGGPGGGSGGVDVNSLDLSDWAAAKSTTSYVYGTVDTNSSAGLGEYFTYISGGEIRTIDHGDDYDVNASEPLVYENKMIVKLNHSFYEISKDSAQAINLDSALEEAVFAASSAKAYSDDQYLYLWDGGAEYLFNTLKDEFVEVTHYTDSSLTNVSFSGSYINGLSGFYISGDDFYAWVNDDVDSNVTANTIEIHHAKIRVVSSTEVALIGSQSLGEFSETHGIKFIDDDRTYPVAFRYISSGTAIQVFHLNSDSADILGAYDTSGFIFENVEGEPLAFAAGSTTGDDELLRITPSGAENIMPANHSLGASGFFESLGSSAYAALNNSSGDKYIYRLTDSSLTQFFTIAIGGSVTDINYIAKGTDNTLAFSYGTSGLSYGVFKIYANGEQLDTEFTSNPEMRAGLTDQVFVVTNGSEDTYCVPVRSGGRDSLRCTQPRSFSDSTTSYYIPINSALSIDEIGIRTHGSGDQAQTSFVIRYQQGNGEEHADLFKFDPLAFRGLYRIRGTEVYNTGTDITSANQNFNALDDAVTVNGNHYYFAKGSDTVIDGFVKQTATSFLTSYPGGVMDSYRLRVEGTSNYVRSDTASSVISVGGELIVFGDTYDDLGLLYDDTVFIKGSSDTDARVLKNQSGVVIENIVSTDFKVTD